MKLYLAGPMRGYEDFNFPAFDAAAKQLREAGFEVFNPADRDREVHGVEGMRSPTGDVADLIDTGFTLREALGADTAWICAHADGIALLPGWGASSGATAEVALGRALGIQAFYVEEWLAQRKAA